MGMFDYVDFEMNCPICGEKMKDFQSKSAACFMVMLDVDDVDNFYTSCAECGSWVEFTRKVPISKNHITVTKYFDDVKKDFDMEVTNNQSNHI